MNEMKTRDEERPLTGQSSTAPLRVCDKPSWLLTEDRTLQEKDRLPCFLHLSSQASPPLFHHMIE